MKRSLLTLVVVLGLFLAVAMPALADSDNASPNAVFGQHVAGMAPHCPTMHGEMFGHCVSMMAGDLPCCPCP